MKCASRVYSKSWPSTVGVYADYALHFKEVMQSCMHDALGHVSETYFLLYISHPLICIFLIYSDRRCRRAAFHIDLSLMFPAVGCIRCCFSGRFVGLVSLFSCLSFIIIDMVLKSFYFGSKTQQFSFKKKCDFKNTNLCWTVFSHRTSKDIWMNFSVNYFLQQNLTWTSRKLQTNFVLAHYITSILAWSILGP